MNFAFDTYFSTEVSNKVISKTLEIRIINSKKRNSVTETSI